MKIAAAVSSGKGAQADLLIAGHFGKTGIAPGLEKLESKFAGSARSALRSGRFSGAHGEIFSSYQPDFSTAREAILVGLGDKKKYELLCLRKAAGQIIRLIMERKARRARILLETFTGGEIRILEAAGVFAELGGLVSYQFNRYKTADKKQPGAVGQKTLELVISRSAGLPGIRKVIAASKPVVDGTLLARELINEPANVMNAPEMVRRVRKMASGSGVQVKVLGQSELSRLKMGGILAVNRGSVTPPALILMEYGKRHASRGTVCLVGKGVTFDTGGLSIKPSKGMEKMKYDMSGAAAVIGTMRSVSGLKLPVHVVGLTPVVENNVAKDPQRPGDIIRMYNGKTVEVLNTDAEGRLILADALAYAGKYKPNAIIDLATLTGMCLHTFGNEAIGIMSNDKALLRKVEAAGEAVGERCWPLPMWEEYGKQIKGQQSDLKNIGGPYGGTITAAKFLEEFVPEKTSWVHLDIAGMAWCESPRYDAPVGAMGVGVRLLTELIRNWRRG